MNKVEWKPGTMIYPVPAVMVSCGNNENDWNIITISWTGTINTNPPMLYISVRPGRHSHKIIKESGEFVINLTTESLLKATDWCGVKSGKDYDKFKEMQLTPIKASIVGCPMIQESPINIECRVTQIIPLGSHDMFMAEVVKVHASKEFINSSTDAFDMQKANLIAYSHGNYYSLGKQLGHFGHSVKNKK